jgi:hypothetical protein
MTTKTDKTDRAAAGVQINWRKLGAVLAQSVSWLTTYWCVEWIMEPKPDQKVLAIAIAVGAECLLILMKSCLFDGTHRADGVGWAGLIFDTIINAGGILPKAGRVLTFPPIAAILGLLGITTAHPTVNLIGSFVVAIVAGALLSVAPHRLWHSD